MKTTSGCSPPRNLIISSLACKDLLFRLPGGEEARSKHLGGIFHAALMLCLMAGGEHHAPLSGNRAESPKLRIPGEDFGGGTNFLACGLLVFATRQERVVKAGLKCELRRATSKVLIVGVLDHLLPSNVH